MKPAALAAVAALAFCGAADATTLVTPDGKTRPQPYQRWGDQSRMPTVRGAVTLAFIPCGEAGPTCAGDPVGPLGPILLDPGAADARQGLLRSLGAAFFHTLRGYVQNGFARTEDFPAFYRRCAQPTSEPHLQGATRAEVLHACRFICRAAQLNPGRYTSPHNPRRACQRGRYK